MASFTGGKPSILPGLALDPVPQTNNNRNTPKRKRIRRIKSAPQPEMVFHNISIKESSSPSSHSRPNTKNIFQSLYPSLTKVVTVLILYLCMGTVCFYLVRNQIKGNKTNHVLDSLYFCVVTMTTVGYGDLVPNSTLSKLLACAFVFLGMALSGLILTKAADYLVEKQEALLVKALNTRNKGLKWECNMMEIDTNKVRYKFVVVLVILMITILTGTIFLVKVEGMEIIDAFYGVCATVTTLGYGDVSFQSLGGRVFAVFWIFASTIIVVLFFLYLAELNTEHKRRAMVKRVLSRKITNVDLELADMDDDGVVNIAEFTVYKLREMGKITQEDIALITKEFEDLDVDQTGTLSLCDVNLAQSSLPRK